MILVALLPIGTKKFLGVFDVLPEGDYFRIFLNLSDILLLALLAGLVFLKRELLLTALRTVWREYKFLVLFLFFAFISVFSLSISCWPFTVYCVCYFWCFYL